MPHPVGLCGWLCPASGDGQRWDLPQCRRGTEGQRGMVVDFPPGSCREAWAEFGIESVPPKFQRLHFRYAFLSQISKAVLPLCIQHSPFKG